MKRVLIILFICLTMGACTERNDNTVQQEESNSKSNKDIKTTEEPPLFYNKNTIKGIKSVESKTFIYEDIELRGIEGKIGILSTPWKVNDENKYMWHFFGKVPTGILTVVATHLDTKRVEKAIHIPDSKEKIWSTNSVPTVDNNGHTDVPSTMSLPQQGYWVLNAYIEEELFGQVIVNVK